MHVHVVVNGLQVKDMVDSGVAHNFMATKKASKLGLKLEDDTNQIKTVNSKAQKIHGVSKNVLMQVGDQNGTCSLLCVPLDDFNLILGIDFVLKAKMALISYLGGLMVLDEIQSYFMQVLRAKNSDKG